MNIKSQTCFGTHNGSPLTEYQSASEARQAAEFVSRQGSPMMDYRCETCGMWHLSPASRHTPSEHCASCGKERYSTKQGAERRAALSAKERGVGLDVYACPYENGWHLTKR